MTRETLFEIEARLKHARTKHPYWKSNGKYWALGVILSEVDELIHAVEHETQERQHDEALDVIATCVRFAQEEFK